MDRLNTQKKELLNLEVIPPLSESILSDKREYSLFESNVLDNPELQKEVLIRKNLIKSLDSFYKKVPDATENIEKIEGNDSISEDELIELYSNTNKLLGDEEYVRMVLYYPFEMIPNKNWISKSEELNKTIQEFKDKFLSAWERLIPSHDYRTNFVDGDILEPEIQTHSGQARVSKASHLIPILLEKGLIDFNKVFELAENTPDLVVKNSILDTWGTLYDMNLISEENINKIKNSKDSLIRNMGVILENIKNEISTQNTENAILSLKDIGKRTKTVMQELENDLKNNSNKNEVRKNWEKERDISKLLEENSTQIFQLIQNQKISIEEIKSFANEDKFNSISAIGGATKFILNSDDLEIIEKYKTFLTELSTDTSTEIRDALTNAWAKIEHKNIDKNYSQNILPAENAKITLEIQEMKKYASIIESNEELKKYLYPVVLLYGSKIKGYGGINSDTDIALFIKPNTNVSEQEKINEEIKKTLNTKDAPMKFWIKEVDEHLEVIDMPNAEKTGWSYMTNILWNGAWCGNKKTIKELHNKLIAEYFYKGEEKINGIKLREIYLRELERDTLQYRLMHKGYGKFHASQGGIHAPNSKDIDSESVFWDSGYRRLATRLFVEKVFIPNLKKDK